MALFSKLFGGRHDAPAQTGAPLGRAQFADHYVRMLARLAPEIAAERVDGDVRLRWPDGGTMTQFLGNAYTQFLVNPGDLDALLAAQLASARATAQVEGLDLARVMPLIKSRAWLATATEQAGDRADFVLRPLIADLIVVYAQDLPDTISYVRGTDLDGVCDEAQLTARALANLSERVPALQIVGGEGRYRIELDGFFDASLILVAAEWLDDIAIEGDPVFAIPTRDQLMVCGAADPDAVAGLAEIAQRITQSDAYDISGRLLTLRNGALQAI